MSNACFVDLGVVKATTLWRHYLFFLASAFLVTGNFFHIFSANTCPNVRGVWAKSMRTVKTGQSWCLFVIFGKKKSFWQFHRKVDPAFLKTCVQDHVDSFSQLPKKKDWLASLGIFFHKFFLQYLPQCSWSLSKIYVNVCELFPIAMGWRFHSWKHS